MIPWIYLLPTMPTAYRSNLKTLRENPEMAPLLHRWAGLRLLSYVLVTPLLLALSPVILMVFLAAAATSFTDWVANVIPRPLSPLYRKVDSLHWEINKALQRKRVRG